MTEQAPTRAAALTISQLQLSANVRASLRHCRSAAEPPGVHWLADAAHAFIGDNATWPWEVGQRLSAPEPVFDMRLFRLPGPECAAWLPQPHSRVMTRALMPGSAHGVLQSQRGAASCGGCASESATAVHVAFAYCLFACRVGRYRNISLQPCWGWVPHPCGRLLLSLC